MTNLVIVESPAKCQKIQGYLGPGWKVVASMGHIRALEETLDAIGLDNDFQPKYQFLKEKAKALKGLKEAAADATTVYLAADDDREGEAIAYSVCLYLKLDPKTTPRAVFHEITEKAVKAAVNNPRYLDMNRVNAQQARAMLDMMIGFTMSPLLWRYVSGSSLSAGRCQTPALRLIVEREDLINNFKSVSSWKLSSNWTSQSKNFKFNAQLENELEDEDSALNYMENVNSSPTGIITSKDIRPWSESAPLPLITSTLQQQASALFGINPKGTMKIAQRLYEGGHITYMRTDKAVLSEEAINSAKTWVKANLGEEYIGEDTQPPPKKTKKVSEKVSEEVKAQEAHEAIRPTHMEINEITGEWSQQERKVYALIWQRAIQSTMAPARGETCKVRMQIDGDEDFTWVAQWKRTVFEGWKRAGSVAHIDDDEQSGTDNEADSSWDNAVRLEKGTSINWTEMTAYPHETKAQSRFTEATLVRELEKFGIGRPSTFASLLSTIQDKGYAETKDIPAREIQIREYKAKPNKLPAEERVSKKKVGAEKNKLVPTDLGRTVLKFMLQHFDDLFEYNFTSAMEKHLDMVAEGTYIWKQVLRDMWSSYKDRYNALLTKAPPKGAAAASEKVKDFSGGLKAVSSKKGPILLIEGVSKEDTKFLGWPTGIAFQDMTEERARKFITDEEDKRKEITIGDWNGQHIVKKTGKFGEYIQCGEVSINYQADESLDSIIGRLEAKVNGATGAKKFKSFEIRTGQYGPYIMKTGLKKPQFVSLPKDTDIEALTEKEVEVMYKLGLEKKQLAKKFASGKK